MHLLPSTETIVKLARLEKSTSPLLLKSVSSLFVLFDSLCPSQQSFTSQQSYSYVGTGLPGMNQY